MSRRPRIATEVAEVLRRHPNGATIAEIHAELSRRGNAQTLPHSLRAAIYQRLSNGEPPRFERLERGRYRLRQGSGSQPPSPHPAP